MKRLLLAAFAVALVTPGAGAATGSCIDLADPGGDLVVWDGTPALPAGTRLDALDVLGVRAEATTGGAVTVTYTLAGPPEPAAGMTYTYALRFHDAQYAYDLDATVDSAANASVLNGPYELYITPLTGHELLEEEPSYSVSGSIDVVGQTVTIMATSAMAPLLGDLDPGRTFTLDRFDTFGGAGMTYGPFDEVAGPHTLVVGDGC